MRSRFADAKVGADMTTEDKFYANRVDLEQHFATEHWDAWHLKVNAGVSLGFGTAQPTPAQETLLDLRNVTAQVHADTKTLTVLSGGRQMMVLDIAPIFAMAGAYQLFSVEFGLRFNEIVVIVVDRDYTGPLPRFLSETDVNPSGAPTCSNTYVDTLTRSPIQCQRPDGHSGQCQIITDHGHGNFDKSGTAFYPTASFGFPAYCKHCGFMLPSDGKSEVICFYCNHWLRLKACTDKPRFVVEGRHYMPGAGGFYGRKFKVRQDNGALWTGELFTQGEVPAHMRNLFPDNAVFED